MLGQDLYSTAPAREHELDHTDPTDQEVYPF